MASKKYKITQLQNDDSLLELHPATDADIVAVEKNTTGVTDKYPGTATNVQDALEEVYALAATGGVTGVKGNAEVNYRTGNVNLTPANIGAEAAFTDGSAVIASVASDVVTIKGGVKQSAGAILNKTTTEAADIVLAKVAKTGSYNDLSNKPTIPTVNNATLTLKAGTNTKTFTANASTDVSFEVTKSDISLGNVTNDKQVKGLASGTTSGHIVTWGSDGYTVADSGKEFSTAVPSSSSTDTQIPTAKAVWSAIDALPEPMIFKGSLGTGGTITSLPAAAAGNEGYVYKVITAGTYASQSAKVGDTFISTGSEWVLIPSGDEPTGTVTSVGMSVPTGLKVSGSPITSSGTLAVTYDTGYSIPTDAKQTEWDNKQDALAAQTAYTNKGSATKVPQITTNALGQVTNITEVTITDNNDNQKVKAGNVTFGVNDVINFVGGTNVTVTGNATDKTITIASSYTDTNQKIKVGNVTFGADDVINFVAGTNVTSIVGDATNKTVTINVKDTTYENKAAASGGTDVSLVTTGDKYTWNNKYAKPGTGIPSSDLANSGVTAGTYSAVTVNAKGIVTAGAQMLEVGTTGQTTPSSDLAVGGIFFQEI